MNISILCPSRGRPELARRMAESAVATCSDARGLEILFYLNEDDPLVNEYRHGPYTVHIMGKDGPTSYAWNELAKRAAGDILMLMGDDVVFETPGWDEKLRKEAMNYPKTANEKGEETVWLSTAMVFSFDDGRSPLGEGHPHPAMTREVYNRLGYLACPMFKHFYVDTWLVELAKAAGIFHYLPDVKLGHHKPAEHGGADETKLRISRTTVNTADQQTYIWAHAFGHFDVDLKRLKGLGI